jgi:hypothetical protein
MRKLILALVLIMTFTAEEIVTSVISTVEQAKEATSIFWQPLPGPQTQAYTSEADEIFYGGAAGGGKTDLGIGLAITAHRKTIFFRREMGDLRDVIERSRDLLGTVARLNENLHIWRNIPGGRSLEFGYIGPQGAASKRNILGYKGRPHDLKFFDEVSDFTEDEYLFLTGWARSVVPGQRVRTIAAGNPPTTPEGEWVVQRWGPWLDPDHPNPAKPGEIRWFARIDDIDTEVPDSTPFEHKGETITPKSRTFIPARLSDNPYLANTGYGAQLQGLREPLRSQLLYGDFTIKAADDIWQVIPSEWVRMAQQRWRDGQRPDVDMRALGVDVSRGGRDKTTLARLFAAWFEQIIAHAGQDTPDGNAVAKYVEDAADKSILIVIDVAGVGASPYDILRKMGYRVAGFNSSAAAKDAAGRDLKDKTGKYGFVNIRAAMWWRFYEALDPASGENIALPDDREVFTDLTAARFKIVGGRYQIESKDDIRLRISRSPDKGEAILMAWYGANQSLPAAIMPQAFAVKRPQEPRDLTPGISSARSVIAGRSKKRR